MQIEQFLNCGCLFFFSRSSSMHLNMFTRDAFCVSKNKVFLIKHLLNKTHTHSHTSIFSVLGILRVEIPGMYGMECFQGSNLSTPVASTEIETLLITTSLTLFPSLSPPPQHSHALFL